MAYENGNLRQPYEECISCLRLPSTCRNDNLNEQQEHTGKHLSRTLILTNITPQQENARYFQEYVLSLRPQTFTKMIRVVLICLFFQITLLHAQHEPVTLMTYENWPIFENEQISNDGKYVLYSVESAKKPNTYVVSDLRNTWKSEFSADRSKPPNFTADNQSLCYVTGDTLSIQQLGSTKVKQITHVSSYKITFDGTDTWIAYRTLEKQGEVVLINVTSNSEYTFPLSIDFTFNKQGSSLALVIADKDSNDSSQRLLLFDLKRRVKKVIFRASSISTLTFDDSGSNLAFFFLPKNTSQISIGSYHEGMDSARIRVTSELIGTARRFQVAKNSKLYFSSNGRNLFFNLVKMSSSNSEVKETENKASLDIWNYKDEWIQSMQQAGYGKKDTYLTVSSELSDTVVQLEGDKEVTLTSEGDKNSYLITVSITNSSDASWRTSESPSLYLVSVLTGARHTLSTGAFTFDECRLSPNGTFVVWYNSKLKSYFSYDIQNKKSINITNQFPFPLYDECDDHKGPPFPYGIAGWIQNANEILIYDKYDIWRVDLKGQVPPINITRRFGRVNKLILRGIHFNREVTLSSYLLTDSLYLSCFNESTKDNSFLLGHISGQRKPRRLLGGRNCFYFPQQSPSTLFSYEPTILRSRNNNIIVYKRMGADDYPNLYATDNFEHFYSLTMSQPHKSYNWLTVELVKWQMFDGKKGEGILYKPQNFDSNKRYPIIFYFYERLSNSLNQFLMPEPSNAELNISYFVSNGYLVFVPNNYYHVGDVAGSVYNSVVSAAAFLARKPWVDASKLGVLGHSFGGYQVNCLVTRTKVFSAAVSCSGLSNLTTVFGNINGYGSSFQPDTEGGQFRLGRTLWSAPNKFIENSPVFFADKVTTPILFMHNKGDMNVPWQQSLEFFMDLRRLNKKSWLLQYDNGEHFLIDTRDRMDFSIRLFQFFNHYLKGAPAPKWMTEGIPFVNKMKDYSFEFDKLNQLNLY